MTDEGAAPLHAGHGRFAYLSRRLVHPVAIIVPLVIFALSLIGGGSLLQAVVGAVVAYALIAVLAFRWAVRHARDAFFESYANTRGLERHEDEVSPALTPLLHMGDRRWVEGLMIGTLPGGLHGALAHYTYEDHAEDDERRTIPHEFTVAIYGLPGVTESVLELYCEPRSATPPTGITGFRKKNRLRLESVALDRRCEIFYGAGEDEVWLRRLHSPTFIVWLSEHPPEGFGFQLSNGSLCAFVPGHRESAAELDALCEAASVVATRVLEEAAE